MEPKTKTAEQALNQLMNLCAKAERSSGDARRLMYRWGVEAVEQEGVLEKLIDNRFIDDDRYAHAYVRDKIRFAGWGRYKIAVGLAAKGVAKPIVERALVDEYDSLSSTGEGDDRLERIVRLKMRSVKAKDLYDLRAKLIRFALSRGFEVGQSVDVVERLIKFEDHREFDE